MKKKDKYGNTDYGDMLRYVHGEMTDVRTACLPKRGTERPFCPPKKRSKVYPPGESKK